MSRAWRLRHSERMQRRSWLHSRCRSHDTMMSRATGYAIDAFTAAQSLVLAAISQALDCKSCGREPRAQATPRSFSAHAGPPELFWNAGEASKRRGRSSGISQLSCWLSHQGRALQQPSFSAAVHGKATHVGCFAHVGVSACTCSQNEGVCDL